MMKTAPSSSFIVTQSEFLFQFFIVPFNDPAMLGEADQFSQRNIGGEGRKPVLGRFGFSGGPFD
jgi:hypothetical protein